VVGGFLVTDRMLGMFKRKPDLPTAETAEIAETAETEGEGK
jgi:hypothetical protein